MKRSDRRRPPSGSGRFAYEGLDRLMHEKARLGIMTSLATRPQGLLFNDLKHLCSLTDGNLSRHLQTLQEAGLVEVWKGFHQRRQQTLCRLSEEGRERFVEYLGELERVVRDAAAVRDEEGAVERSDDGSEDYPPGWVPA